ncbi:MAG: RagB/SusD family nutrient uptake outer membrane protein [Proteiniphilum sp.]|nr:RagB/SusD family nutrient uptake outer membrane protein [Proteiniphilum sp.]
MNNKIIRYLVAVSLLALSACSLDEETFTFVAGEDVAAAGGYDQLVTGAYVTLSFPFEWGNYANLSNFDTDYQTGPTWAFGEIGAGNFYDSGSVNNFYKYYCQSVHRANYHYYLVGLINNIPEKTKKNALGELRFLKAWAQFQLVQFYGEIPLFTSSISEGNIPELPRSPIKEVYEHIIETLKEAESLLLPRTDSEYQKGHVCRGTAKALLAKVYATIGSASMKSGEITVKGGPGTVTNPDGTKSRLMPKSIIHEKKQVAGFEAFDSKEYYRLAREKAWEVINEGEFQLANSQEELWSPSYKNGPEFQFCLQTIDNEGTLYYNYLTSDYWGYPKETDHNLWTGGYYVQRDHWLQMFDDWEDERITWGIKHRVPISFNQGTGKMIYCFYPERDSVYVRKGEKGYDPTDIIRYDAHLYGAKLRKFTAVTSPIDGNRADFNWPYMRYAETLLLFAEADNEVNNGPSAEALAVVSKLNARNKSTTAIERNTRQPFTQESFRSYILEERAKELAEEGCRRTDLLRWGIYLQVMNAIGTTDENGVIKRREQKHLLFPLPPNEVNANPYIETNNPGW